MLELLFLRRGLGAIRLERVQIKIVGHHAALPILGNALRVPVVAAVGVLGAARRAVEGRRGGVGVRRRLGHGRRRRVDETLGRRVPRRRVRFCITKVGHAAIHVGVLDPVRPAGGRRVAQ